MSRREALQAKAKEVEGWLEAWAKRELVLSPGERISCQIAITTIPIVEVTVDEERGNIIPPPLPGFTDRIRGGKPHQIKYVRPATLEELEVLPWNFGGGCEKIFLELRKRKNHPTHLTPWPRDEYSLINYRLRRSKTPYRLVTPNRSTLTQLWLVAKI